MLTEHLLWPTAILTMVIPWGPTFLESGAKQGQMFRAFIQEACMLSQGQSTRCFGNVKLGDVSKLSFTSNESLLEGNGA